MSTAAAATQFFQELQKYEAGVKVPFKTVIAPLGIKPSWFQVRQWMNSAKFRSVQPDINVMVFYNNGDDPQKDLRETDEIDANIELLWAPDMDFLNHELFLLGSSNVGSGVV